MNSLQLIEQGHIASEQGKVTQARAAYKKALDVDPNNFDAAFFIGSTYASQGNMKMATTYFRRATEIDPSVPEGFFNLGYAYQLQDLFESASQEYLKAIKLRSTYHQALHNLGVVYDELGDLDQSLQYLDLALMETPDAVETHYTRGSVLIKLERWNEALEAFDVALRLMPNHLKALNNRGLVHFHQQNFSLALDDFSKAILLDDSDEELYRNKGKAAAKLRRHDVAADSFSMALKLKDSDAETWHSLACELESLKRNDEALRCFEKVKRIRPDTPYIDGYIFSSRLHYCDWTNYEEQSNFIINQVRKGKATLVPHPMLYLECTRADLKRNAESFADFCGFKKLGKNRPNFLPYKNKKIRIGYFSADYHTHPVAMLIAHLFELHDREHFEIFGFSLGPPAVDAWRVTIEKSVDHFFNVRDIMDDELVKLSRDNQIDIAVDLTGYTAHNRTNAFSLGLAPIQINYLGFSGTMGLDFMDYIIADPILIPPEHDADYSEHVVRLPDSYMPTNPTRGISNRPMQRSDYGLPEDKFVFCGFNNITKLNPGSFSAWMKILTAVPNSVIWLSPAPYRAAQNIHNFARKLGVDSNRIIFSNREDKSEDHLARQRLADLFLDSFPHNAHATSCDALWAGLPILTRIGQGYAARVAASLLNAVGMPEMVTTTTDDFINKAICIANTPGESERLKAKLAQNLLSMPLFNTERYARNLEKAYTIMMERYQNGEAPSAINI